MKRNLPAVVSVVFAIMLTGLLFAMHLHLQNRNKTVVLIRGYFQSFEKHTEANNDYYFTPLFLENTHYPTDTFLHQGPNNAQNLAINSFEMVWWYADKYPIKPVDMGSDDTSAYVSLRLGISSPVIVTLHFERLEDRLRLNRIENLNVFYTYLQCRQLQVAIQNKNLIH